MRELRDDGVGDGHADDDSVSGEHISDDNIGDHIDPVVTGLRRGDTEKSKTQASAVNTSVMARLVMAHRAEERRVRRCRG